jgi:uncharacterized membrane protein YeaQ/YmgE (transglycosylase-associated protein family)
VADAERQIGEASPDGRWLTYAELADIRNWRRARSFDVVQEERRGNRMEYGIIAWLVIGAIAGWLAGQVVKGGGFGLIVDIIVGIVGAVIGGFLAGVLGISIGGGIIGSIIVAFIGAVILLFILRHIKRA